MQRDKNVPAVHVQHTTLQNKENYAESVQKLLAERLKREEARQISTTGGTTYIQRDIPDHERLFNGTSALGLNANSNRQSHTKTKRNKSQPKRNNVLEDSRKHVVEPSSKRIKLLNNSANLQYINNSDVTSKQFVEILPLIPSSPSANLDDHMCFENESCAAAYPSISDEDIGFCNYVSVKNQSEVADIRHSLPNKTKKTPQCKVSNKRTRSNRPVQNNAHHYDINDLFSCEDSCNSDYDTLIDFNRHPFALTDDDQPKNALVLENHLEQSSLLEDPSVMEDCSFVSEDYGDYDDQTQNISTTQEFGSFTSIADNSKYMVLALKPNTKVFFRGLLAIQVLRGAVEILGYTVVPSKTVELYSARGSAILYIETNSNTESISKLHKRFHTNGVPQEFYKDIREADPDTVLVFCKRLELPKISFLEEYIAQQIFPNNPELQCSINNWSVLKVNPDWDVIAEKLYNNSKFLICGGQSVGKSVLIRYMINKALMKHHKVLVIDLDAGQSEFTIPGCISATVVEEPVFGPNYTHLRDPLRCLFIPEVNISLCYKRYITEVKHLISLCHDLKDMPTIINFMGFTRGFGMEILAAVVAIVKPTTVVQIKSATASRNYQNSIEYSELISKAEMLAPEEVDSMPVYTCIDVASMSDEKRGWHLQPRQIREMSVLAYFGNMLSHDCENSLSHPNVPVYECDLSKIILLHDDEIIEPEVINANMVALCTKYATNSYNCHGWGIVRSVDIDHNVCYLITPLAAEKLELIDYFIMGSVQLPPTLYMTAKSCSSMIPYVSACIQDGFGALPKKSYMARKSIRH